MAGNKTVSESRVVTSIFLFSLLPIAPWIAVFWDVQGAVHVDDGPAAFVLLAVSAIGTLLAQSVYCGAMFLLFRGSVDRRLTYVAALLICCVLVFCVGSSLLWAKVSMDGGLLFGFAAGLYAIYSLKLVRDVVRCLSPRGM